MTQRRFRFASVCVFAFVHLALAHPAAAQFSPVSGREYREFFNTTVAVRGEAVVGLSLVPAGGVDRAKVIEVWLPDKFSGELHVETLTADGRFRGEGVYTGSGAGGSWVPLALTTSTARPGDPATLALAVRGPGDAFFVARWGAASPGAATKLRLYINTRRADMFVRAGDDVVRCTALNVAQPVRFDGYCDLSVASVPADGKLTLIRRDQFDEQTQDFRVNVRGIR